MADSRDERRLACDAADEQREDIMKKKLIEVALPLDAINKASKQEKHVRNGHPANLHLWWARRPLVTSRAILFAQLVDDPSAHPDRFQTEEEQNAEREHLFEIIKELVEWEQSANKTVIASVVVCKLSAVSDTCIRSFRLLHSIPTNYFTQRTSKPQH